jgi:hypothetical protein
MNKTRKPSNAWIAEQLLLGNHCGNCLWGNMNRCDKGSKPVCKKYENSDFINTIISNLADALKIPAGYLNGK